VFRGGSEEKSKGAAREIETNKIKGMILRYDKLGYLLQCIIPQVDHYLRTRAQFLKSYDISTRAS
jgi:hypothetical protein